MFKIMMSIFFFIKGLFGKKNNNGNNSNTPVWLYVTMGVFTLLIISIIVIGYNKKTQTITELQKQNTQQQIALDAYQKQQEYNETNNEINRTTMDGLNKDKLEIDDNTQNMIEDLDSNIEDILSLYPNDTVLTEPIITPTNQNTQSNKHKHTKTTKVMKNKVIVINKEKDKMVASVVIDSIWDAYTSTL